MKKEILNKFQKEILLAVAELELGKLYVWTGGTALAYEFHHRLSEDLDFFSLDLYPDEFILAEVNKIRKKLKISGVKNLLNKNRNLFELQRGAQILKLEFVYFPFANLKQPQKIKEFNLMASSALDLAVNKLFALYERAEAKDIFDLYFLFREKKYLLDFLIKNIQKKFGVKIDKTNLYKQAKKALDHLSVLKPFLIKQVSFDKINMEINQKFQANNNKFLKSLLAF
ncbi:MAG: nucleotidyl transferase AbiEii/AbiGii toxin family protein [bacterium]